MRGGVGACEVIGQVDPPAVDASPLWQALTAPSHDSAMRCLDPVGQFTTPDPPSLFPLIPRLVCSTDESHTHRTRQGLEGKPTHRHASMLAVGDASASDPRRLPQHLSTLIDYKNLTPTTGASLGPSFPTNRLAGSKAKSAIHGNRAADGVAPAVTMKIMKIPDPSETPTVDVPTAGQLLGISRGCAYNAVKAGDLPAIRCGKRLRVPTAASRRMLEIDAGEAA